MNEISESSISLAALECADELLGQYLKGHLKAEAAARELTRVTGGLVTADWLSGFRGEKPPEYLQRLSVQPLENWPQRSDLDSLRLIRELQAGVDSQLRFRVEKTLELRYALPAGTVGPICVAGDPEAILEELNQMRRGILKRDRWILAALQISILPKGPDSWGQMLFRCLIWANAVLFAAQIWSTSKGLLIASLMHQGPQAFTAFVGWVLFVVSLGLRPRHLVLAWIGIISSIPAILVKTIMYALG